MCLVNKEKNILIRPAKAFDIPTLTKWDTEAHVIKATTDSETASKAFGEEHYWEGELNAQDEYSRYYIVEVGKLPIGALQIIDPHNERTHYWGAIEPNLRAIDIWLGEREYLGKGFGSEIMKMAINYCFSPPNVTAIVIDPLYSNKDAHRFYQRLGFLPIERKLFDGEDDCLVHRLEKNSWLEHVEGKLDPPV